MLFSCRSTHRISTEAMARWITLARIAISWIGLLSFLETQTKQNPSDNVMNAQPWAQSKSNGHRKHAGLIDTRTIDGIFLEQNQQSFLNEMTSQSQNKQFNPNQVQQRGSFASAHLLSSLTIHFVSRILLDNQFLSTDELRTPMTNTFTPRPSKRIEFSKHSLFADQSTRLPIFHRSTTNELEHIRNNYSS